MLCGRRLKPLVWSLSQRTAVVQASDWREFEMNNNLTKRMRDALKVLRAECDYEKHQHGGSENYVLAGRLGYGIGEKTLSDLQKMGLVAIGECRLGGATGYMITDRGRAAIS